MNIKTGRIEGTDVARVIMENSRGTLVELLSMGAGIRRVAVKSETGYDTLTQSFVDYDEYIVKNTAYDGKTLAPNAGRFYVSEGIDLGGGNVFHPEANERGINSLHGSSRSVSTENWKLEKAEVEDGMAIVVFTVSQPDGLCGWPGNRDYTVTYTLDEDSALSLLLEGRTDAPTYLNMSNHAYWNLNLVSDRAMEQLITIRAEGVVFNNADHIPSQTIPVSEILESDGIDFSAEHRMKDIIPMESGTEYSAQMRLGKGLNNAFTFGNHSMDDCLVTLSDSARKHTLRMYSDAPAMVIYSSGSMDEGLALENGQISGRACSAAFEFQEMPSLGSPVVTTPDAPFARRIVFKVD